MKAARNRLAYAYHGPGDLLEWISLPAAGGEGVCIKPDQDHERRCRESGASSRGRGTARMSGPTKPPTKVNSQVIANPIATSAAICRRPERGWPSLENGQLSNVNPVKMNARMVQNSTALTAGRDVSDRNPHFGVGQQPPGDDREQDYRDGHHDRRQAAEPRDCDSRLRTFCEHSLAICQHGALLFLAPGGREGSRGMS